ncbi:MAG: AAA family ATPase, partial [Verrucomicrobiota bacterium]
FWTDDYSDEEWLAYPVVPKGRAIALYAPAKAGKSTVVLAIAAAVASGRKVLGARTAPPATVLYLDYEMTSADLQERLYELGYGPDADLSRLKYALLPSLPPMDTVEGARAILHLVEHYGADFVVFDTFGRAVEGEEDHADTVRAFYRHTGLIDLVETENAILDKMNRFYSPTAAKK